MLNALSIRKFVKMNICPTVTEWSMLQAELSVDTARRAECGSGQEDPAAPWAASRGQQTAAAGRCTRPDQTRRPDKGQTPLRELS